VETSLDRKYWVSRRNVTALIAFAMSAYHLYTGFFGAPISEIHYPLHLLLAFSILFLAAKDGAVGTIGWRRTVAVVWDLLMVTLTLFATGYLFLNAETVTTRMLFVTPLTTMQWLAGIAAVFVVLEAARRAVGWPLVVILVLFLLYARFGYLLPGALWHRGYGVDTIIEYTYLTTEGLFGVPVGVMALYVFHFVLFGSLLVASGAGDFFTDFARSLSGRTTGGPLGKRSGCAANASSSAVCRRAATSSTRP
jgi:TRAP-type uncharacterized transport system fused permease subunit